MKKIEQDALCALCGFPLFGKGSHYTEGVFCDDVAGCRRRALHQWRVLLEHFDEMKGLVIEVIGGIDAVHRVAELPDLPKRAQPDLLRQLAQLVEGGEGQ
jgi:hypothetical protein